MTKWLTWWTEPWPEDGSPPVINAHWVCKALGHIVRDATVRLIPLFLVADAMEALKFIYSHYKLERKRDWYQIVIIPEQSMECIAKHMERVLKNEWFSPSLPHGTPIPWVAASDASDLGWGYVILRGPVERISTHEPDSTPGRRFPETLITANIFIKELYAAFRLIKHVAALNQEACHIVLTLLMDNTAAMHCIRNWYSKNEAGNRLLKRMYEISKAANISIKVEWIGTDDNPADEPSRFENIIDKKCKRALEFADGGWFYEHKGEPRRNKDNDVPDATHADLELEECAEEVDVDQDRPVSHTLYEELELCNPSDVPESDITAGFEIISAELWEVR